MRFSLGTGTEVARIGRILPVITHRPKCSHPERYRENSPRRQAPGSRAHNSTPGHRLIKRRSIDVDDAIDQVDGLSTLRNHALNENIVLGAGNWILEYDDLAVLDIVPQVQRELLREDGIAHLYGGLHRPSWNGKRG